MGENTNINIYKKVTDNNNYVNETLIFSGKGKILANSRAREYMGGVEDSSKVIIGIYDEPKKEIKCGDVIVADGKRYTIYGIENSSNDCYSTFYTAIFWAR